MERRAITPTERAALQHFLDLEISLEALLGELNGQINLEFLSAQRRFTSNFLFVEPPIKVEERHLTHAFQKFQNGQCSDEGLRQWATMLLLNDSYDWSHLHEEAIDDLVSSLQELSIGGIAAYKLMMSAKKNH